MIANLTAFYRLTLRKSKELIPIKDELEIARLYLEMEKLCHKDNLDWEIEAEDGIENFLICKFTLQPFSRKFHSARDFFGHTSCFHFDPCSLWR